MARRSSYDVSELESALGPRGSVRVDSGNRALVQNWLVAHGLPAAWVKSRKISFLNFVYNSPAGLAGLLNLYKEGRLYSDGKLFWEAKHEDGTHIDPTAPTEEPSAALTIFASASTGTAPPFVGDMPLPLSALSHSEAVNHTPAAPAPDPVADMKLAAAAEALRAAATLAQAHEKLLERMGQIEKYHGIASSKSVGDGPLPGTSMVKAADIFDGIGGDMVVPRFDERTQYVPDIDANYRFDPDTTIAVLLGFGHNRRVLISGRHGTGKTTHIEQVAARLNWPFLRLNLDGHLSRTDLIGRDAIVLSPEGKQITEFREGVLPWAMQQPMALCLDEYDAGRPDVLFVVQRLLETSGKLTIAEQNRVVSPHGGFRLFGTANTVGLGDASGLYHGTNPLNAAQMDRWSITVRLDYLSTSHEIQILRSRCPDLSAKTTIAMVKTAASTRALFAANKISTVMSPRTVITWGENAALLGGDTESAFRLTFLNKCDDAEQEIIKTCYSTAFAKA